MTIIDYGWMVWELSRNEAVKVQVVEFSPGAVLLSSPSTVFSGYFNHWLTGTRAGRTRVLCV